MPPSISSSTPTDPILPPEQQLPPAIINQISQPQNPHMQIAPSQTQTEEVKQNGIQDYTEKSGRNTGTPSKDAEEEHSRQQQFAQLNTTIARLTAIQAQPVSPETAIEIGTRRAELRKLMAVKKEKKGKKGKKGRGSARAGLKKNEKGKETAKDKRRKEARNQMEWKETAIKGGDEDVGKGCQILRGGTKKEDQIEVETCSKLAKIERLHQMMAESTLVEDYSGKKNTHRGEQKTQEVPENTKLDVSAPGSGNHKDGKLANTEIKKRGFIQDFTEWMQADFNDIKNKMARENIEVTQLNLMREFFKNSAKGAFGAVLDDAKFTKLMEACIRAPECEEILRAINKGLEEITKAAGFEMGHVDELIEVGCGQEEQLSVGSVESGVGVPIKEESQIEDEKNRGEKSQQDTKTSAMNKITADNSFHKKRDVVVGEEMVAQAHLPIEELVAILNQGVDRMLEKAEEQGKNIGKMVQELRKSMAELDSLQRQS